MPGTQETPFTPDQVAAMTPLAGGGLKGPNLFTVLDTSDPSQSPSGTIKVVTAQDLFSAGQTAVQGAPSSVEYANRGAAGSFASTFDRGIGADVARTLTGGRIECSRIFLPKGQLVTAIQFWAITTSAVAPTHQWFGLFDLNRNQLGVTTDDTSAGWTATAGKKLNLAAPYTTTYSGLYYVGVLVTATTTLPGIQSYSASLDTTAQRAIAPVPCFAGDSSLTTPATCPAQLTNAGAIGNLHYAEVS